MTIARLAAILLTFIAAPALASATTVVKQPLDVEVAEAGAVAIVRCDRIESRDGDGEITTWVGLEVLETLAGPLEPGPLAIELVGGEVAGERQWISGSAEFEVGRLAVVFLAPNDRGSWTVAGMYLGKWDLFRDDDDVWIAVRQKSDALEIRLDDQVIRDEVTLEEMRRVCRARDIHGKRDAFDARQVPDRYRRFEGHRQTHFAIGPNGIPIRWFEPDSGGDIAFTANPDEFSSPADLGAAVSDALSAWSGHGSRFRYRYAGIDQTGRGYRRDQVNRVSVDATNQIAGSGCSSIIAIGGFSGSTSGQTITVNGVSFRRGLEGDVVLNDGYCDLYQNPTYLRYILTHELGHALGLGHSSVREATMYGAFLSSNAARGAAIGADDEDGLLFIYPPPPGPPRIESITPNRSERAVVATLEVNGTNLQVGSATSVAVSGSGIGPVTLLAGSSSTLLRVSFSVAATAPLSDRTLTVTTSEGSASKIVTIVEILAPDNLTAAALSSSSIRLDWTDRSQVETSYRVQRYQGSTSEWLTVATLPAGARTWTDTGLRASKRYKYRVRVQNASASANSNQAEAVTLASRSAGGPR